MKTTKVGFIGLGNMGMAMAKFLPKKFTVTVFDLKKEAMTEMASLGARLAKSSKEVAEASDIVITMVKDIPQTEQVIFGDLGVWEGMRAGGIIVISSSIGPQYCRDLYAKAKKSGIGIVDAAVSDPSGTFHSTEGGLTFMVGGEKDIVEKCLPVFSTMSKNIFHLGEVGMGQSCKMVSNMLAMHLGGVNRECLNMGIKAGLDLKKMIEVLEVTTGGSWSMHFLGEQLKRGTLFPRPPSTKTSGPNKPPRSKELEYALTMATDVGAKMPICQFIDDLDMDSTYEAYASELKKLST